MAARRIRGGRWPWAVGGVLLFGAVFLGVVALSLPSSTLLSLARGALSGTGLSLEAREARIALPIGLRLDNAVVTTRTGTTLPLDRVEARWEITGLWRWLPGHLRIERGNARLDLRTSPAVWRPGRIRARAEGVAPADLAAVVPSGAGLDFLIESADFAWNRGSGTSSGGMGTAALARLVFPIPAPGSPVREALLTDVRLRFAVRGDTIQVPSLTGSYEGAKVEGSGEIGGYAAPEQSRVMFQLKIHNPLEGKVAVLFNLVSKNAKNANLRVTGTLLAPQGRFEFF